MQSTLKRLAAVAAMGTIGILMPAAGASAEVTPVDPAVFAVPGADFPAPGSAVVQGAFASGYLPGSDVAFGEATATDPAPLADPGIGQVVTVTGLTALSTAPVLVVNVNNQSAAGDNLIGVQSAPW
jgi:hypothetical protein